MKLIQNTTQSNFTALVLAFAFVCGRYYISKSSLMRWNKKFDSSRNSLFNKLHRPYSPHPSAYTQEELKWIQNYHHRNPKISVCELYDKLRTDKGYKKHSDSLDWIYWRLGYSAPDPSAKTMLSQRT